MKFLFVFPFEEVFERKPNDLNLYPSSFFKSF